MDPSIEMPRNRGFPAMIGQAYGLHASRGGAGEGPGPEKRREKLSVSAVTESWRIGD
jgi:hypothetical protein